MKANISELCIEITRVCNMACSHCLRGDMENVQINIDHVDKLFSQISSVGTLTITGGEPSLYPEMIMLIVETAKAHKIDIQNFYMVTNAKKITEQFLMAIMKLRAFCTDNEISSISVSGGAYHNWDTELNHENVELLKSFSFFHMKEEEGARYDDSVIGEGYALDNFANTREINFGEFDVEEWDNETSISGEVMYLNCEGVVLGACDLSYESQREKALHIGNVQNKDFNLVTAVQEYNDRMDGTGSMKKSDLIALVNQGLELETA